MLIVNKGDVVLYFSHAFIFPSLLFTKEVNQPSLKKQLQKSNFIWHQVVTRLTALVDSRFWDPFTILSTYFNIISRNIFCIPLSILTYSDILNQARSDLKRLKCKWTRKVVDKIPLIVRLQNPLKKKLLTSNYACKKCRPGSMKAMAFLF